MCSSDLSRPNIGIFTQPLSFIGLPIIATPIFKNGELPLSIQLIAAPGKEASILRVASYLESVGLASAPVAGAM